MSNNLLTLMDQFFDDGVRPMAYTLGRNFNAAPALNVKELDDRYEISLSVPGIDAGKTKVEMKENILTISYEDGKEERKTEGDMVRQEYSEYLSFTRSLSLPKNVDEESVKAKYSKGILTVTINKSPDSKPKSFAVEVAE